MSRERSEALYNQGCKHLVGAVNSPVRAFKSVGGNPVFIDRAKGATITDVDGNEYLDFVLSYGPMILGHGHEAVIQALELGMQKGLSFGASTENEIILAEMVCAAFPGMDKIRFVNSGTEAVMSAIRLARAYTSKNKIIKFTGCYHGHMDALLVSAGSGVATLNLPSSAGVTQAAVGSTLLAQYNDFESVKTLFDQHEDIAAIIIEPIAGNMGVIVPEENFLQNLKALANSNGAVLIADEVMTGFRSRFGGAQTDLGIEADITCLGKVIGGGMPVGAYGARNEIMELVAPLGPMYQAGTLSGNPLSMICGIATLNELKRQNPYERFNSMAHRMEQTFLDAGKEKGIAITVNKFGSMINPFFTEGPVKNFTDVQQSDSETFNRFFWNMMENGLYIAPSAFEAWFLNSAMSDEQFEAALEGIGKSIKSL